MRHGYYVNGRRFTLEQRSQAIARAEFLTGEYRRNVNVTKIDHDGTESHEFTGRMTDPNSLSQSLLMLVATG